VGGVPRVAQTIRHFFASDFIVPVKDLSLFEAVREIFLYSNSSARNKNIFVHNIYSLRAVLLGLVASVLCRGRLFVTPHGATNLNLVRDSFKKKFYLKTFSMIFGKFVYRYHYLNEGEAADSYIKGCTQGKTVMFSYPILVPSTKASVGRLRSSHEGLRIVFFSRVERRKGIFNLLTAVDSLNSEGFKIHLDIFGPVESAEVMSAISAVSSASYHGMITLEEYIDRSSEFDVFCLPSFGEAHSLALMENVLIGLPCLVSKEANSPSAGGVFIYGRFDDINALKAGIRRFASAAEREKAAILNVEFGRRYNAAAVDVVNAVVK
jgi:glycosyltransferase involved in cell wall biosynthesis